MNSKTTTTFIREITTKYTVDVFIAGGGPAGVAAAVSAARSGCSVYLAEGQACLGGMGTSGLIPAYMQFSDGVNFLAAGIGEEIYTKLHNAGGTGPTNRLAIKAEVLKRVYDDLLLEAGVTFTLLTQLIGVDTEESYVTKVVLSSKSGLFAVKAKIYIDCTGDGDLAVWAGAPYEKGDEAGNLMPGTLCSLWAGVEWETVEKLLQSRYLEQAFQDGIFTVEDRHLPGMWAVGDKIGGGNIGHAFGVDGTDEVSLTNALIEQRKRMLEYETYYKKYLKGFENIELVATGSLMGIRETRRIIGDYILNLEDFHKRAVFADEIGRYCYPIDIHPSKPDKNSYNQFREEYTKTMRYAKGESYGIPYRTLVPKELSNVLVAGRCISSDRYIQGSVRVMPGCYITGQAAGVAASVAIQQNTDTRGFDVEVLQEKIKNLGGYLPNFAGRK